jgi:hypothetical protein
VPTRPPWRMWWFITARRTVTCNALNASTGTLLWSFATRGQVNSSPAVASWGGLFRLGGQYRLRIRAKTGVNFHGSYIEATGTRM